MNEEKRMTARGRSAVQDVCLAPNCTVVREIILYFMPLACDFAVSVSAVTSQWANEGSSAICKLYFCLKIPLNPSRWDVLLSILCYLEITIPREEKKSDIWLHQEDFWWLYTENLFCRQNVWSEAFFHSHWISYCCCFTLSEQRKSLTEQIELVSLGRKTLQIQTPRVSLISVISPCTVGLAGKCLYSTLSMLLHPWTPQSEELFLPFLFLCHSRSSSYP